MAEQAKETEVELVTMNDGRKVEFAGKRKMIKTDVTAEGGPPTIRIDFRNGETRTFASHTDLVGKFAAHGMLQKYGDETAGVKDLDDQITAVDDLHERLSGGKWSEQREGGIAGTSVLARALVEMYGGKKTIDEVKTWLKTKTPAEKSALRINGKLAPIIQRIEAEKAAGGPKVDTDALLEELN
jgi:hypothetical protein